MLVDALLFWNVWQEAVFSEADLTAERQHTSSQTKSARTHTHTYMQTHLRCLSVVAWPTADREASTRTVLCAAQSSQQRWENKHILYISRNCKLLSVYHVVVNLSLKPVENLKPLNISICLLWHCWKQTFAQSSSLPLSSYVDLAWFIVTIGYCLQSIGMYFIRGFL